MTLWYNRHDSRQDENEGNTHRSGYRKFARPLIYITAAGMLALAGRYLINREFPPATETQATESMKRSELPKFTPKPVNFVPVEPVDITNNETLAYIRSGIEAYKASINSSSIPDINRTYLTDMDNDGRNEIIVTARNGPEIEIYVMRHNQDYTSGETRFFGSLSPQSDLDNLRVFEVNGRPEIVFNAILANGYPYTIVTSDEFSHPKGLAGVHEITDIDGDGLPEFCAGNDVTRWDGKDFSPDKVLSAFVSSLAQNLEHERESQQVEIIKKGLTGYYGGNPDIHDLHYFADGPGLREKPDYMQPPSADQYTVSRSTSSGPFGTSERREIALTPQSAQQIRTALEQERINQDPVVKASREAYQALERIGQRILPPPDAKKK